MGTRRFALGVPDEYVPTSNQDLIDTFGTFVARLVTKYNRVFLNYDDLLQHVWLKLFEVDVLEKYNRSGSLPQKITALQACAYLQITWGQFKVIVWRANFGERRRLDQVRVVTDRLQDMIFDRDHGLCHCCGRDMDRLGKKLAFYRENAKRSHVSEQTGESHSYLELVRLLGISPRQRFFWYADKIGESSPNDPISGYVTTCFLCWANKYGDPKEKSKWAPLPVEGSWSSKHALYDRKDIERLKEMRDGSKRCKKHEEIEAVIFHAKCPFKMYLARAVHNIYANWCRTRDRRYKEHLPNPDAVTGEAWETTLVDSFQPQQDDLLALYEASKLIAYGDREGVTDSKVHEDVMDLAAEGYSVPEIVRKLSLPTNRADVLQS